MTPTVTNWSPDGKQFSLIFDENPLADFVELPDDGRAAEELWYSNVLCGVLRGALEMVCSVTSCTTRKLIEGLDKIQIQIEAHFISDVLKGHDVTELRVALIKYINDEMPPDDE